MDDTGTQQRRRLTARAGRHARRLLAEVGRVVLAVAITALLLALAGWLLMVAPRR
jgi:CHASE3 domain sensor protein